MSGKNSISDLKFETRAIHVGEEPNFKAGAYGDVSMPIHVSSTFAREKTNIPTQGYEYSRSKNPTRDALEKRLASLENADYGLAFASGLAAETTILLSLLKPKNEVIAFDDLYGGTRRLFNKVFHEQYGIEFKYVDARDSKKVEQALTNDTKMIWLETPTNPLLKICDIQKIAAFAKRHNILVVVDNTFATPYFQSPLALGADIVVHSTTKYINGHSDSIGGAIMLNNPELYQRLKFAQNAAGAILSPFDSYLVLRGTKTLGLRMKQHAENAMHISQYLSKHPKISKVIYPGLSSHPQHELAKKQMQGFGGMISFELDLQDSKGASTFVESLEFFAVAESLGGVESLIEVPAMMTHASIDKKDRENIGLSDSLIRLSVGIEHVDDLIQDLEQGLKKI